MTDTNKNYCKRCGNCCQGYMWQKVFKIQEAYDLAKGNRDEKYIENILVMKFNDRLNNFGIPVKKEYPAKWIKNRGIIVIRVQTGKCNNLFFTEDDKAMCKIYENRPKECRDFLCKKANNEKILDKIKESEKKLNIFRRLIEKRW